MANVSDPKKTATGTWVVRWKERAAREDGAPYWKDRSRTVTKKTDAEALVTKLRTVLATDGYAPDFTKPDAPVCNIASAAVAWVEWKIGTKKKSAGTGEVLRSAMRRFFGTVRSLEGIADGAPVPATVLSEGLFARVLARWSKEDASGVRKASEWRQYDLALHGLCMWEWAAGDPATYPGVPAPPQDRGRILPPAPVRVAAATAPSMPECDAVIGYADDPNLRAVLATLRYTGLRRDQVTGILAGDVDCDGARLTVRVGKSRQEKADMRTMAIAPALVAVLRPLVAGRKASDPVFREPPEGAVRACWEAATAAGEVRAEVWSAHKSRRKNRPNHAFRAAFMQVLQDSEVVKDATIDFLVGHAPKSTRGKAYTTPSEAAQRAAVGLIPAILPPVGSNVVRMTG